MKEYEGLSHEEIDVDGEDTLHLSMTLATASAGEKKEVQMKTTNDRQL